MNSLGDHIPGEVVISDLYLASGGDSIMQVGQVVDSSSGFVLIEGGSIHRIRLSPQDRLTLIHALTGHSIGVDTDEGYGDD
jgi:hypothetical protein